MGLEPRDQPSPRILLSRGRFLRLGAATALGVPLGGTLLSACGGGSTSSPSSSAVSKTLRVRLMVDLSSADPAFYAAVEDAEIADCVLEGLVTYKPGTTEVVNVLAKTFERSKDGLRYRFELKEGMPFHGGYGEVTASDVKYSFERIAGLTKPAIKSPYVDSWSALQEVKVDGKYSGTVILKKVYAPIERITFPVMTGKIVPQKAVEKLGQKFGTAPVGSGPYQFTKWVPKQATTLTRFADYGGANTSFDAKQAFSTVLIEPIAADSAASNALRAGDVDMGELGVSTVPTMQKTSGLDVDKIPSDPYVFLAVNMKDPQLSNADLRQAIRYAVDVPAIIEAAYGGLYQRANAPVAKSVGLGYWADAPQYDRDVDKAKGYLQSSGLSNVTLKLTAVNAQADTTAAQVIQSNLKDIGITVKLDLQDQATFYAIPGNGGGGKDRQLVFSSYTTNPDPAGIFQWWLTSQIGQWNFCNFSNTTFDADYQRSLVTLDDDQRTAIYIEMQKLWDESATMVWVANETIYVGAKQTLKPSTRPDGFLYLWNTARA